MDFKDVVLKLLGVCCVRKCARRLLWQEVKVRCRVWIKQWRGGCLIFKEAVRDGMFFYALKDTGAWRRAYES